MKRFLLLLVFAGIQTLALAQTSYDRLRFGLQLTPNFSWVSPQSRFTNAESSGFGFGYGLMAEYKLTDNYFSIRVLALRSYRIFCRSIATPTALPPVRCKKFTTSTTATVCSTLKFL